MKTMLWSILVLVVPLAANAVLLEDDFESGLGLWSGTGATIGFHSPTDHSMRVTPGVTMAWSLANAGGYPHMELSVEEKHLTQSDQDGQAMGIRMPGGLAIAPTARLAWGQAVHIWKGEDWYTAFWLDTGRFNLVRTWNTWRLVENGPAAAVFLNNVKVWEDLDFNPNFDWSQVLLKVKAGPPAGDYAEFDNVVLMGGSATVSGTVRLDGNVGDNTTVGLKFILQPEVGTDNLTRQVFLAGDGAFSLPDIPMGKYDVFVKGYASLDTKLAGVLIASDPTVLPSIVLTGNDINGDDTVSFEDFSILQNSYGQSGTAGPVPASAAAAANCGLPGVGLMVMIGLALGRVGLGDEDILVC